MATVRTAKTRRGVVLYNVDWRDYQAIGRALADRPALRLTYDRGALEIMTISSEHDRLKHLLRRLLEAWTEERGVAIAGYGSMTFKRRRFKRGLEPDECYWIVNETQMRGRDRIDLRVDPPPDLVLEIDISRSSLDRMGIYSVMGVPEVWRYRKQSVAFLARQPDGRYVEVPQSLSLSPLASADLLPFLALRGTVEENAIIRQFRAWIGQKFPPGSASPAP
jgi:Uma2 family endonuclease